eukprot:COSAG01_NODE_55203_length_325_cov_18.718062_1_plen_48_part_01
MGTDRSKQRSGAVSRWNLGFMEPFTLTRNPQPAAPNPIGIGCWLAVSV